MLIATNQSGIGRGFHNREDVEYLHSYINEDLIKINAKIDMLFILHIIIPMVEIRLTLGLSLNI